MQSSEAFQDLVPNNHCFGCGPDNEDGLRIKSYWDGDESVCTYHPQPHQAAGPPQYLNGGIIATVMDCHSILTAVANAYRLERRQIGTGEEIWCATGRLSIDYLRPTAIDSPVDLRAAVLEATAKKTVLRCTLSSLGEVTARAEVIAVRVPEEWRHGRAADEPERP